MRSSPIPRYGSQRIHTCLAGVSHVLVQHVQREPQRRWIPADLLTPGSDLCDPLPDLVGRQEHEVQLVGEPDRQASRPLPSVATDDDRDVPLDALGHVDGVTDLRVTTHERGVAGAEHPGDDLEVVPEGVQPLTDRRESVAVCQPLVLLPAGTDAQLEATAADDIQGRGQLGRQRGIAEGGAHDHVAEPDSRRDHRDGSERRERLERDLVGRVGHGMEMVERPQGLEAERLGIHRQLDRPPPGGSPHPSRRTRPSIPGAPSTRPASPSPCWDPPACVPIRRWMGRPPMVTIPRRRRDACPYLPAVLGQAVCRRIIRNHS